MVFMRPVWSPPGKRLFCFIDDCRSVLSELLYNKNLLAYKSVYPGLFHNQVCQWFSDGKGVDFASRWS